MSVRAFIAVGSNIDAERNVASALELLGRDGVLVQPGFFYDFETEAFLVVSLLTPPDVFCEGVGRLLARAGE